MIDRTGMLFIILLVLAIGLINLDKMVESKPDDEPPGENTDPEPTPEVTPNIMKQFSTGKRIDVTTHKNIQLLPTLQECGFVLKEETKPSTRIFSARTNSMSVKYPWMVRLVIEDTKGVRGLGCSGTIISSRYVLTTANCIAGLSSGLKISNIILGTTCENGRCSSPISKVIEVSGTIIYPDFVRPTKQHDIGIIRLEKEVPFDMYVRPVCLPQSETLFTNWKNNQTTIVGWNKIEEGSLVTHMMYPRNLQTVEMTLELRDYCDRFYKRSHAKFGPARFCTSGDLSSNKIACTEDEGGPALKSIIIPDLSQERVYQVGIVSFQHKLCGQPGIPGGFTNIIYYMSWILDNLSLN